MSKRSWNQVKVASKASKRGCMDSINFCLFLLNLALTLLYFAELAFSLCSKQGQHVGLHDNPIWHSKKHMEADLELKLVNNWSKST